MGLGAYQAIDLAMARELASESRDALASGREPIDERDELALGECTAP